MWSNLTTKNFQKKINALNCHPPKQINKKYIFLIFVNNLK